MINSMLKIIEYVCLFVILASLFYFLSVYRVSNGNNRMRVFLQALIVLVVVIIFNFATENIKDNFLFELTPEKWCLGGEYMRSSSPELQQFCSKFSSEDIDKYQCNRGYIGKPVWRGMAENANLSDANFENKTCSEISPTYNDPQVL